MVVILGPTAGGKSELAVRLAQRISGEIVNADSMQVYRRLDAGTAKPTLEQRRAVMHHLVDVVDPAETWTVADWLEAAEAAIRDIRDRGAVPLVVGGTNLYLKALLEGLFEGPPPDEAFRQRLEAVDAHDLHRRLERVDPDAAERINRNDRKRIVRALEVYERTGTPISKLQRQWSDDPDRGYRYDAVRIGLRWPTPAINRRINARVKRMFQSGHGQGLIEETRRLEAEGALGPQAREALGTSQALAHLHGELSDDEAMEQTKIATRRFAKAQRTWLKRFQGVHWLEAAEAEIDDLASAAERIYRSAAGRKT